jgi:6-phosphogluconolactonase
VIAARNSFENRNVLAQALAISRQGHATLAISGGTTPALFFEHLSHESITWEKVTITLVDERQVDEDSPRSNARLVKANLFRNEAASATFVPLFRNELKASELMLDVVVLGMGEDGHTASFFPGGSTLASALDAQAPAPLLTLNAPGAGEPRLTFSLAHLLKAKVICLHIEGAKKQEVLVKAEAGTDIMDMPIRAVLQSGNPIEIFWCP